MKQRLKKIGEHVWILPFDSPKDRPNLGYIKGKNRALAVDAGHSSSHVEDFYAELEANGLLDYCEKSPYTLVLIRWTG